MFINTRIIIIKKKCISCNIMLRIIIIIWLYTYSRSSLYWAHVSVHNNNIILYCCLIKRRDIKIVFHCGCYLTSITLIIIIIIICVRALYRARVIQGARPRSKNHTEIVIRNRIFSYFITIPLLCCDFRSS